MATELDFVFTEPAQRALSFAQEEAQTLNFTYIGTEHLLLGLLRESDSTAAQILLGLGISLPRVRQAIFYIVGPDQRVAAGKLDLSPRTRRVIELASSETKRLGGQSIDTAHLLLGLTRDSNGVATYVLTYLGVDMETVRHRTVELLTNSIAREAAASGEGGEHNVNPLLKQLGVDLTEEARHDKLDPVIGRQAEIDRVIQILRRRTKNNPALIGEPGVGKTAIVEGLAQKIVHDPENPLRGKCIWMLNTGALVAGAIYRGQFEERLRQVLDELKRTGSILFIDEFHTLVGAGANGGALDAANILKPMLARGELQFIGATTLDEYRRHIEKDAALERRFQPVLVEESSVEDTILILEGLRPRYEEHHQLIIADEAVQAAAHLAARYIPERYLPDKALDLVDEAASRAWMYRYSKVPLTPEMRQKWQERLSEIRGGAWTAGDHVVTRHDIAEVVSLWTGIPVTHMVREESQRLLQMEEALRRQVVGQEEAIQAISRAVRLARVGLKNVNRPIGSFLFVGPTGVGKTELGKALAHFMLGSDKALIKLDMSEFMERHAVSRLIGSPPGYVGYEDGGQLTEAIRRRPYSVLLFDEIDKAHPEALNLLLQIIEDGALTESSGRRVDFRHAMVVMTANVGSNLFKLRSRLGFGGDKSATEPKATVMEKKGRVDYENLKEQVHSELKARFAPEFLSRLDGIIVFRPLEYDELLCIVDILLQEVHIALREKGIVLEVSEAARAYLVEQGYDPKMGARPLRSAVRNLVSEPLSELLLDEKCNSGDVIRVDCEADDGGRLIFYDRAGRRLA